MELRNCEFRYMKVALKSQPTPTKQKIIGTQIKQKQAK